MALLLISDCIKGPELCPLIFLDGQHLQNGLFLNSWKDRELFSVAIIYRPCKYIPLTDESAS